MLLFGDTTGAVEKPLAQVEAKGYSKLSSDSLRVFGLMGATQGRIIRIIILEPHLLNYNSAPALNPIKLNLVILFASRNQA